MTAVHECLSFDCSAVFLLDVPRIVAFDTIDRRYLLGGCFDDVFQHEPVDRFGIGWRGQRAFVVIEVIEFSVDIFHEQIL